MKRPNHYHVKPILLTPVLLAVVTLTASISNAAVITFESGQGYTNDTNIGALNPPSPNPSDAPFTGQQGWSLSTSNGTGRILTTTNSGEYTGGQALGANSTATTTYIGGKLGIVEISGINTITFDARYDGGQIAVGFLGNDGDNLFDQSVAADTGIQFGGNGTLFYRGAGFSNSPSSNPIPGIAAHSFTTSQWYRHTITIGEISGLNRSITMSVRNLSTSADLDLNGAPAGTSISFSVANSIFGVAPEAAVGGFVRISNPGSTTAAIDNINFTAVPEPNAAALIGSFGMLALLRRRRNG